MEVVPTHFGPCAIGQWPLAHTTTSTGDRISWNPISSGLMTKLFVILTAPLASSLQGPIVAMTTGPRHGPKAHEGKTKEWSSYLSWFTTPNGPWPILDRISWFIRPKVGQFYLTISWNIMLLRTDLLPKRRPGPWPDTRSCSLRSVKPKRESI